mgnify:CR=1 FL=1
MKIKYPNPSVTNTRTVNEIPNGNHGMMFENALNTTNEYYRIHNKAIIYKKPTPIQVVRVDYPSRSAAKIVEAYYRTPSTTDYNGIYKGKYIDYEAKETIHNSFAFKHIFPHQIKHLVEVDKMGGIAFVIIYYKKVNKVVIIDIKEFVKLYNDGYDNDKRKSLPVEVALKIGREAKLGFTPPISYLDAVDELYKL